LFTSKRYPRGREKQAVCAASVAFVSCKNAMSDSDENFALQACMLNTLIEYPFYGIYSPRDVMK
jgi:hypothetical protein